MLEKEVRRKTTIYSLFVTLAVILLVAMIYSLGTSNFNPANTPNPTSAGTPGPISQPNPTNGQPTGSSLPVQTPAAGSITSNPVQTPFPNYPVYTSTPISVDQNNTTPAMQSFASVDDLNNYVNSNATGTYSSYTGGPLDSQFLGTTTTGNEIANAPVALSSSLTPSYSTTNVQVAGVDEADSVKTDGQYIYTVSTVQPAGYYYANGLGLQTTHMVYILKADPQNPRIVAKINLGNNTQPAGLFLSTDGTKLAVLASTYQYVLYGLAGPTSIASMPMLPTYRANVYTFIYVYDVSNRALPTLTRNFTVSGSYFNSRMIGNYVYAVVSQPVITYANNITLPTVYSNNTVSLMAPTSIYYSTMVRPVYFTYTSFFGINLADDTQQPTSMTVLMGGASTMYVSKSNIYVTYPTWTSNGQYTSVYRVSIKALQLTSQAQGTVPGYVINQYAMDENINGYFRVVTNRQGVTQSNNVYVMDPSLNVVGKLEGLALNESLYSVRFIDDKCYIVTYLKTDPLFVVDLSNPLNPVVLGGLYISGYSNYLYPYDDTHLIGVGKETVNSTTGNFAWYQGLKLALFDVTDVNNPALLSNYTIGNRGTDSAALLDPKAFLIDKDKGLLVIPVNLAIVDNSTGKVTDSSYGQLVWQGVYVFGVNLNGGFTLKGTITHVDPSLLNANGYFINSTAAFNSHNSWVIRSLYIGNTLYTVSNVEVKLNSLTDLSKIAQIPLS